MEQIIDLLGVSKKFHVRTNPNNSLKLKCIGMFNTQFKEHVREIWALRNVNLRVMSGESVGIIGPNGSGKSTIFKLIAGILAPSEGTVVAKGLITPMIELGVGFHPELSGIENIFLNMSFYGISRANTLALIGPVIEFSELEDFIESPIKYYSTGMVARLAFALSIQIAPDILLIDEVLSVGDHHFQKKCIEKMLDFREMGRTILFASHSMDQVLQMCERTLLVWQGRVVAEGPTQGIIDRYIQMLAEQDSQERTLQLNPSGGQTMLRSEEADNV